MLKASCYAALAVAAFTFTTMHSASATTVRVGTCKFTHKTTYVTVQAAVDAAADGDVVAICPGDYPEQVSITKNVSLHSVNGMAAPHIVVPAGGLVANTTLADGTTATAAQILVSGSATAGVNGLVVDAAGNNNTDCNLEMVGIYYKGASGNARKNTVENQIGPVGHQNCQNGIGILVENVTVGPDPVTIEGNTVQNFDKNGIVMRYPGSVGTISHNTVTGLGPTTLLAQNGIELRDHASANISLNNVSGFVYSPDTTGSAGIILFNVSSTKYQLPPTVQKNTVDNTQFGVALDGVNGVDGNMVQVLSNTISNSKWDGIELESDDIFAPDPAVNADYINVAKNSVTNTTEYEGIDSCGDHNTITKNTVTNSTNIAAIHLDSLCSQANGDDSGYLNTVTGNRIDTACVAILSGPAEGANAISGNQYANVTHARVFGSDEPNCTPFHAGPQRAKVKHKSGSRLAVSP